MRRPKTAAGRRLVDAQNAALARASTDRGETLVWSEAEEAALERAGETVDRAEAVRKLLAVQLRADEPNSNTVVKLSAELRMLDKLTVDLLDKLNPDGEGPAKSARHVRAARSRWDRTVGGV